jgi:hypothetical protein
MQINELDQPKLYSLQNEYLEDTFAETTSAEQLQRDAYVLGYKRAELNLAEARALLTKIMQNHVTALPLAIRVEIEAVIA